MYKEGYYKRADHYIFKKLKVPINRNSLKLVWMPVHKRISDNEESDELMKRERA